MYVRADDVELREAAALVVEGRRAGEHLVEDDAEAVDVRARVYVRALGLLWRDVLGRAVVGPRVGLLRPGELDDAEVCNFDAVIRSDEHVGRLQVAVNQSPV